MPGNSFGRFFRITTFGESHGAGIGVVIDGAPPKIAVSEPDIQHELDRRRPGQSAVTTPRNESDRVQILSGVFEGKTTGSPLALYIQNKEYDSSEYLPFKDLYRPGHADYTYQAKYGIRDWRGGGRASGRETAARVAAGAVAKIILREKGISIIGYTLEIGGIVAEKREYAAIERDAVRAPDPEKAELMIRKIKEVQDEGDSLGGVVEVVIKGCSPGLGDPVFDKLEALLAHAVMSIGAVKGFEVGKGFESARMRGLQYNDPLFFEDGKVRTRTNNAGGILGGISTGEDIVFRAAVRPTASIGISQETVNIKGQTRTIEIKGRHDPCIVPRIVPVVEAMAAVVVTDCMLASAAGF